MTRSDAVRRRGARRAAVLALATLAVLVPVVARRRLLVVTVSGASMEPAYGAGTRVLVARGSRARPGDVVVLDGARVAPAPDGLPRGSRAATGGLVLKRVAAGGGDPVPAEVVDAVGGQEHDRVPPGRLVVLGDAPEASVDSRRWGYVPADAVVGRVAAVLAAGPGTGVAR
ncbi:S26 family signal peptidase [Cellulosimicrobium sp. SH8]|uniref:S26 family signal peptidase n=1 Tax=Cellulosimicrobium sp. SH8 TaxID=2952936 RepID=UPI0021F27488|nr:S26 family signal peptidase [Cellulosimicrobium sp. SH8]